MSDGPMGAGADRPPAAAPFPRTAMFSTCLHCHASLGVNTVIEHFAVGRRLAFDAAKGRLWVVCAACHRWNLTPLEERWEAIEECERLFSGTRLRASTDNVGLARLGEGLELVRIGAPRRPEIAAWRYAGNFRRRWVRHIAPVVMGTGALYAAQVLFDTGLDASPAKLLPVLGVLGLGGSVMAIAEFRSAFSTLVLPDGRVMARIRARRDVRAARLDSIDGGWGVRLAPTTPTPTLVGVQGVHALRCVTAFTNYAGGRTADIDQALALLDDVGDPALYIRRLARVGPTRGFFTVGSYPPEVRLALEMALHDDVERRALGGELAALETEWAMAEEIARIADNLLVPASVTERYDSLRTGSGR